MQPNRKLFRQELVEAIQSRMGTYEIQQVMDLLQALRDEARDGLMTCSQDQFQSQQSKARTYEDLIKMLTRPNLRTKGATNG